MNFLLDTHALIWFIMDDARLAPRARACIEDDYSEVFVSSASLWEIAIKMSVGKLRFDQPFSGLFPAQLETNDIRPLPISIEHLRVVSSLPFHHRDPFDRLIIAQSLVEEMPLISIDRMFDLYGVGREWG